MEYRASSVALVIILVQLFSQGPVAVQSQPAADEVKSLPGVSGPLSSKQYSGYLLATGSNKLHYWFAESQGNPTEDPVVLWLNGGPSCSSISGYLTELGPYLVNADGKTLSANEYSWTKVASVIFLESPAGVGYSYADSPDYTTDDNKTAENNLLALVDFFKKFPTFVKNDFYITGESYAGIYIPTLAMRLMESRTNINFKGFAIGNGALDYALIVGTQYEYAYSHAIIGDSIWKRLQDNCCSGGSCQYIKSTNPDCVNAQNEANHFISSAGINPYDVTGDCRGSYSTERNSFTMLSVLGLRESPRKVSRPRLGSAFLPCVDTTKANTYMNLPEVRTALHIPSSLSQRWITCNAPLAANYTNLYSSMAGQFRALLPKYRALVYGGDAGDVCNFLSNQKFAASLGQPQLSGRRPWTYDGQVAGFVKEYKQLTFMTVKNAGHMVPTDMPGPALQMISNFLKGKPQ